MENETDKKAALQRQQESDLINYVKTEMSSFDKKPFSPVDSLVLSQMSYMHVGCAVGSPDENKNSVRLGDLYKAELFISVLDNVRDPENNKKLLFALCASPRYRDIMLNWFINTIDAEQSKQFCAMTCFLPNEQIYVVFRGTDSTVVGWKEDLHMTFMSQVPSQKSALDYLTFVVEKTKVNKLSIKKAFPIMVGGHSKGGNLAMYAAIFMDERQQLRIQKVFSHDGPGFKEDIFNSKEYLRISNRINKTLPKSSLVGMMLEHSTDYDVVKSDRMGIMQHDPFSWQIIDDSFAYTEKVTASATYMNQTLNTWFNSLSDDKKQIFVDTLFSIIETTDVEHINEFPLSALKELSKVLDKIKDIDEDTRKCISAILGQFVRVWLKTYLGIELKEEHEKQLTEIGAK